MKHGSPSLARLVACSALLLGLSLGGTACGDRPTPTPTPSAPAVPDAERSSVVVTPSRGARANGQDTVDIRVTVLQADGTPLAGRTVMVAASGEGNTLTQPSGPTDEQGVASAKLASRVAGTKTVTVTVADEGGPVTLSSHPSVEFGLLPATRLVFTASPTSGIAGQVLGTFEVRLQDALGQTVTGASDTVTVALGAGSPQATLKGALSVPAVNGVARFSTLSLEKAAAGYTLVASAGGLESATSAAFEVLPAPAASLALTSTQATVTAGTPVSLMLSALDAFGNTATGYTGTVRFASTEPQAVLPADHAFSTADQGRYTASVTLKQVGRPIVSVADTANTMIAGKVQLEVVPAAATRLVFTQQPTNQVAGQGFGVQVTLTDDYGNRPDVSAPPVTLTLNKGTLMGPGTVAPVNGVATFSGLSIVVADTGYVLTASAPGLAPVMSTAFNITAASVAQLVLTAQSSTVTAGTPVNLATTAQDIFGNTVTGYAGTVHFTSTDALAVLPADHTFSAADQGRYLASATLKQEKKRTVTVTDTVNTALTSSVELTVVPAAATRLVFTQQPMSQVAGQGFGVQVTLTDDYGNHPDVSAPPVMLTLNKGTLAGPQSVAPVSGVATFSGLSIAAAGTGYVLTASAPGLAPVMSTAFDITAASVAQLVLTAQSSTVTAGTPVSLTVTAQDSFNNRATGYTGTVAFTSSDPLATLPANYTFTPQDAGQHSFSLTLKTAKDQTVTVTDTAMGTLSATTPLFVNPGPAAKLVFRTQPASTQVRQILSEVKVAITDAYGNALSVTSPDVTLGLVGGNNAAMLLGTVKVTPVAGVATFSTLSVDQQGTDFWLAAMAGTLDSANSARFSIEDNVAPSAVSLSATGFSTTQVDLSWTAVGDDGTLGTASSYELRYSTSALTEANFSSGTQVTLGVPKSAGQAESVRVSGLTAGTRYYFGLKVKDDVGLTSLSFADATTRVDVCAGVTCTADAPACAADGVSRTTYTAACVDMNGTATCQQTGSTTACSGSNAVCVNATCDTASRPAASGLLLVSEVMHSPSSGTTEYVELTNLTDSLFNLNGLTVSYSNGSGVARSFLVDTAGGVPLVIGRKASLVLAQNKDTATNGGVAASYQYPGNLLLDGSGVFAVSNGSTPLTEFRYTASFPQSAGKSMNLSSSILGTRASSESWYWCDSTTALSGGDFGTPQAANSDCGVPTNPSVATCYIDSPKTLPSTVAGTPATIYGRFKAPGATDRNLAGNDNYPYLVAELGYGLSTSDATTWTWTASSLDGEYEPSASSDLDQTFGTLNISTPGSYKYGFRYAFRAPGSSTPLSYVYCGQSGITGTANGSFGTVTITSGTTPTTGHLVISEFSSKNVKAGTTTVDHNDEFIELYNPTNAAISLTGWKVQYRAASSSTSAFNDLGGLTLSGSIAAKGYFLLGEKNTFTGPTPDATYTTLTSHTSGSLRILNASGAVVDQLAWGSATNTSAEGTFAPYYDNASSSLERKANASSTPDSMKSGGSDELSGNGYDSDNNANDFVVRATRDPQNSSSPLEPR